MIPSKHQSLAVTLTALLASGRILAGALPLLGTTVYMTTLGQELYRTFYLPIVVPLIVLLSYALILRHLPLRWLKWSLVLLLATGLAILPWWDVYQTGKQATEWCQKEGGLHVYKTVEAEGFNGSTSIEYWSQYGFRYVDGYGKRFTLVNGERKALPIPPGQGSRYAWGSKEDHHQLTPLISRSSSHVIDRQTGEELGTLVWFTISSGWWDRLVRSLLPGEFNPWICGWDAPDGNGQYWPARKKWVYSSDDLIKGTIKPIAHKESEQ